MHPYLAQKIQSIIFYICEKRLGFIFRCHGYHFYCFSTVFKMVQLPMKAVAVPPEVQGSQCLAIGAAHWKSRGGEGVFARLLVNGRSMTSDPHASSLSFML